jgi:hypothetical protein
VAEVIDNYELTVGPVTVEDRQRKEATGTIDLFESNTIHDEDGTNIGMEETCREVYYAMRVQYSRRQTDMIECQQDDQFFIRYIYYN